MANIDARDIDLPAQIWSLPDGQYGVRASGETGRQLEQLVRDAVEQLARSPGSEAASARFHSGRDEWPTPELRILGVVRTRYQYVGKLSLPRLADDAVE